MTAGFTLIELVVVIAIVAITTSLVLPRVWQWQRNARVGHLGFARGAVHSSSTLVHAKLLARGGAADTAPCAGGAAADNKTDGAGTVCTEHGLVRTMHGYPASVAPGSGGVPGILGAAGIGTVFNATPDMLRAEGYAVSVSGATTMISRADAPDPSACRFTYTEPLVARTAASISPLVTSGC